MTKLNKQDLSAVLAESGAFPSKKAALEAIEAISGAIANEVIAGNTVKIAGFGKFENFTNEAGKKFFKFRTFEALSKAVADA